MTEETILGVPIGKIKSRRNLLGTWRHFGKNKEMPCHNRQQFDALGVTDLEIAEYVLDCESRKQRSNAIKAADEALSSQEERDWRLDREERQRRGRKEHEAKYEEYLKDYDAPTEADRASLWTLAGIDLALRENLSAQYAYYGRVDGASIQNKKLLSDEVARLSTELRQMQKMLGIDMPTRIKAEQQATGIDVVKNIIEGAEAHYDKYSMPIEHCHILHTDLLCYFKEMGFDFRSLCPRCGEAIFVHEEFSLKVCPSCGAPLNRDELGVVRCPECDWKTTIHDAT